jgi:hypothetical protein
VDVNPADGVRDAVDGFGIPDLASFSDAELEAWEAEFLKVPSDVPDYWQVLGYIDIIRAEAAARGGKRS